MDSEPRTVWILVYPAPDVAEQWVAHCLDFDVVTQGNSLEHALFMGREAVDVVVKSDLEAGHDPFERNQAPDEDWDRLFHLLKHAVPMRHIKREDWPHVRLAASSYDVVMPVASSSDSTPNLAMPEAWMLSRVQEQRDSGSFPPHP